MKLPGIAASAAASLTVPAVARYIRFHRDRLAPGSVPITAADRSRLDPYFPSSDLDRVLLHLADPLPIGEPPLADLAQRLGWDFPSVKNVAGITLDHVIAAPGPMPLSTLFHELVHVVQFRRLGINGFVRQYLHGFLVTGSYDTIPLEQEASRLEMRFVLDARPFDVESELA